MTDMDRDRKAETRQPDKEVTSKSRDVNERHDVVKLGELLEDIGGRHLSSTFQAAGWFPGMHRRLLDA